MESEESKQGDGPAKTVLLLKAPSEEYRAAFRERGLAVEFVEPLQFQLVNLHHLKDKLAQTQYAAMAVTSARAVDALEAVWDTATQARWASRAVWAVGAATARALRRLGLEPRGQGGDAGTLAHQLLRDTPTPATVLFPAGNLRADTLEATLVAGGLRVEALTVYETARHEGLAAGLQRAAARGVDAVVFFSGSGVSYVLEELGGSGPLWEVRRYAVGETTARGLRDRGALHGVAPTPTPAALADLIYTHTRLTRRGLTD